MRGVDRVDEEKRQIWFRASGKNPDQDPYFIHYYRVNFDGTGLVALTEGNGTHTVAVLARPQVPHRHLLARGHCRRSTNCAAPPTASSSAKLEEADMLRT